MVGVENDIISFLVEAYRGFRWIALRKYYIIMVPTHVYNSVCVLYLLNVYSARLTF